jgi:hypothetical protein
MRRDSEDAERKMRLHIANARRYVEEQIKEAAVGSPEAVAPAAAKAKVAAGRARSARK